MAEPTNITSLLIGGSLTLTGIVVSQALGLLSGLLDRRNHRDVRQRDRLEKLSDSVSETLAWFPILSKCHTIEDVSLTHPPPQARQVAMLAHLYFPSLVEPARNYVNGLIRYYCWATHCFQSGFPANLGAQVAMNPESEMYDHEIVLIRQTLDDAIAEEAKLYYHT